jgi:hypothetical protein
MPSSTGRRTDGWLPRAARRLGFDRNPLCRGTDRVEAILRLILVILLVTAVPAAAVAAGRKADHAARHRAQVQRSADHLVAAVLLRNARATGSPGPSTSLQGGWVPARWQLPGQPPRTGEVFAVAGAPKGSTVRIWTGPAGAITDPPLGHRAIVGDVCVAVMATCLVSWLMLLAAWMLGRHVLDRRRLSAWEAGWRASGPLWSGRHT